MADPTGRPSLMPPLATYCDYFERAEIAPFRSHYAAILRPYNIDAENAAATTAPA